MIVEIVEDRVLLLQLLLDVCKRIEEKKGINEFRRYLYK